MARIVRNRVGLFVATCLFCAAGSAWAGVYKWRDAQGNWQFSDRPPPSSDANAVRGGVQEVKLRNDFADGKVSTKPPISNPRPGEGTTVTLDSFALRLDTAGSRNVTIGRAFSGKDCTHSTDVQWDEGVLDLKGKVAETTVAERFRSSGYVFVDAAPDGVSSLADLHLDAELVAMKMDMCSSIAMGGAIGPGSRAYIKVRWTLRSEAGAEPVFSGVSAGAFDAWRPGGGQKGTVLKALAAATDNLLGDREFVDQLTATAFDRRSAVPFAADVDINVVYGDGLGSFRGNSDVLLRSAVTVRTPRGHGSGVLIDNGGFALTNAHVVGSDAHVKVMLDEEMVDARVVRSDRGVDIALLQFDPKGHRAANVARSEPQTGDPLYVVGTPLDLQLSHTVTQGILSAVRDVKGVRFYQTDAAINRGNSGGPVFNAAGELVAVSVSSLVNSSGASMNVNYLIPVGRALAAIGAGGG